MAWMWPRVALVLALAAVLLKPFSALMRVQATGNVPTDELDALRDLFDATQGEAWIWRPSASGQRWNFTAGANPCSPPWQGITCSLPATQSRHITKLQLNNYGLNGSIPSSIASLTHITTLSLQSNSIHGTIPLSIGSSLQSLTTLQLNTNALNGTVSSALFTLPLLSVLELSSNLLTGGIPGNLGSGLSLTQLDLSGNRLGGEIPRSIGALSGLTILVLNNNFLSGPVPDGLCNSTGLSQLDLHNNAFSGALPSCIAGLTTLAYVDLRTNALTGTLPDRIGQLTSLQLLRLSGNRFSGALPQSVGDMRSLTILELAFNRFHGTIPSSVGNLTQLTQLIMTMNEFSGQIPAELGQASRMNILYLQENRLSGTLPETLALLTDLTSLYLNNNNLTGTIPSCLGAMPALLVVDLSSNRLEGTIPWELGNATKLAKISLPSNQLSGTVPAALGNLSRLYALEVDSNHLSGTFPQFLCRMSWVSSLFLADNQFSSSLPSCLGNMAAITQLDLSLNRLDGAIPSSIADLTAAQAISLDGNYLTGTIPPLGADLPSLSALLIDDNYLTGSIPASLGGAVNVSSLDLKGNLLSGRIPEELGNITLLDVVGLNNNLLTGPIPTTFSQLRHVAQLLLSYNFLSGTLDGVFDLQQLLLYNVQLNNNRISGSLPVGLMTLPSLQHLVAVENCMSGTIPEAVCGGPRVISLILDGLHTATSCRASLFAPAHTYTISDGMRGSIPACLFTMPLLASLHLTGNGFTGALPDVPYLGPHLNDLILSHNALTGAIPNVYQTHNWNSLDLSYNRLTGTLRSDFGASFATIVGKSNNYTINVTGHTVRLENNRLSAHIPEPLVNLQNISMLGSNMFSCKPDKSDLPVSDSDRANYQCGSDSFNGPFYFVIAVVVASAIVAGFTKWTSMDCLPLMQQMWLQLQQWLLPASVLPKHYRKLSALVSVVCRIAALSTALFVLVLVPWYAAASHYYGTYTDQYAWVVSAAFLSGTTPAGIEFALYVVLAAVIALATEIFISWTFQSNESVAEETNVSVPAARTDAVQVRLSGCLVASIRVAFLLLNLSVVLGVNIAFVVIALTQSSAVLTLAQILLSAFKLFWISICTPKLIHLVTRLTGRADDSAEFFAVQAFIALFNNIAIPCLVVAVLSPSCFYSAFDAPPPVSSTYTVDECSQRSAIGGSCGYLVPVRVVIRYNPPFAYSYQCSSSFISYYAPSFVYLAIAAGLLVPIAQILALRYSASTATYSSIRSYLSMLVPRILKAPASVVHDGKLILDASKLVLSLLTYLGILLTFGAVFPPLAVTMCAAILSVALQSSLSVGRFLSVAREVSLSSAVEQLDRECDGVFTLRKLRVSLLLIVGFCSCFYALFLFDTAGDSVGARGAYWTLIAMPLAPGVVIIAVFLLWHTKRTKSGRQDPGRNEDDDAVELSEMKASRAVKVSTVHHPDCAPASGASAVTNALHVDEEAY